MLEDITFVQLFLVLGASAGLIALVVSGLGWLREYNQQNPDVVPEPLLLALERYAYQSVASAFLTSQQMADEVGNRLDSVNKTAVANYFYDLIPDEIGGFNVEFVKILITRERFAQMIEAAYVRVAEATEANWDAFVHLTSEWLEEQQGHTSVPSPSVPPVPSLAGRILPPKP